MYTYRPNPNPNPATNLELQSFRPHSLFISGLSGINFPIYSFTDSSDYEEITFNNDPLTVFSAATAQQCFDVTIFDDTVTERTERFTVVATLDPPNTPAVVVSPDTVTIEIRDNEGKPAREIGIDVHRSLRGLRSAQLHPRASSKVI